MLYLERMPAPPLSDLVLSLWYCSAPGLPPGRQRVLPNGAVQIIVNLVEDSIVDLAQDGRSVTRTAASVVTGHRTEYGWLDTCNLAEVMGVVFRPAGAAAFFRERADGLRATVPLDDLIRMPNLRADLLACPSPQARLRLLEHRLTQQCLQRAGQRTPATVRALHLLRSASVHEAADALGCSGRHLQTLFANEVGVSPKAWQRLHRFHGAVATLHTGERVAWHQLALRCGYFDQAHFSNDFRRFAGLTPTEYVHAQRPWSTHVAEDPA